MGEFPQNLAKLGELGSDALLKLFDKYSYQNVNITAYILIAKFDDFLIQKQALQTRQNWRSAFILRSMS